MNLARILRLFLEDLSYKKDFEASRDITCDICDMEIYEGDKFWFIGNKQKMCEECKDEIESIINEEIGE